MLDNGYIEPVVPLSAAEAEYRLRDVTPSFTGDEEEFSKQLDFQERWELRGKLPLTAVSIIGSVNDANVAEVVDAAANQSLPTLRRITISNGRGCEPEYAEYFGLASDVEMTTVPDGIGRIHGLEELFIFETPVMRVPPDVGMLSSLRVLQLNGNQLVRLPVELGDLSSLQQLELSRNQLTALPATCSNLTTLLDLDLSNNRLGDVGATDVGRMFSQQPNLIRMSLEHNEISGAGCMAVYHHLRPNEGFKCLLMGGNPGYHTLPLQRRMDWHTEKDHSEDAIIKELVAARDEDIDSFDVAPCCDADLCAEGSTLLTMLW